MVPVTASPIFATPTVVATETCAPVAGSERAVLEVIAKPVEPTLSNQLRTAVAHALRDYVGQGLGRVIGAGIYCALATPNEAGLRIAAGVSGAMMAGQLARRLAAAHIGTDTVCQQAGVAFCTVLGAAAGGAISALGSNQLIVGIGTCTLLSASASLLKRSAETPEARERAEGMQLSAATFGVLSGTLVGSIDPTWQVDTQLLPARNLGLVAEATVIEVCKSSFERIGPSVDRHALNFEGRIVVALAGMVPYVVATVVFNGYLAGRLQPAYDSTQLRDLVGPALLGALANAIRGASNALAACLVRRAKRFTAATGADCLRPHAGIRCPKPRQVSDKACVRYFLSACRNAMYARLRDAGFSVVDANMISQAVYACFAQCRDLIADLMHGSGWTEPQLRAPANSQSTRAHSPSDSSASGASVGSESTSIIV